MVSFNRYQSWSRNATPLSGGLDISTTSPCDLRLVAATLNDVIGMDPAKRYPGLRVFVIDEEKEYWFKIPSDFTGGASYNDLVLVPYHTPAYIVSNINSADHTISTEVIVLANDAATQYVWDEAQNSGTGGWVALSGSGSQSTPAEIIINFTTSDHVDPSDNTSALVTSINDVTSDAITAKYGTPTPGAETNVVFTETIDNQDYQTCRRYVYLNDGWNITRGTQEFTVTFPAYAANEGTWETWEPDLLTWPAGIEISKGDTEGFVNVYVTHQFDTKYVDAFVFTTGSADIDGDDSADEYGNRVLASATCFKSAQTGVYKVKLVLPIHANNETAYAITLQK